ncbi:hypothetical protein AAF712_013558 [Marasmius tenuissimus]|uniref:Uncharacterized protein n=1 Tax=Marasmius tenuissimus TaxID=585030 RepID=A0ABR2ZEC3_9AGAR
MEASPSISSSPPQTETSTRAQRYVSLISAAASSGYPLWRPSPYHTDTGEEQTIKIGDVGVYYDTDPFHTLFNITEPFGGITDGARVPDGVTPHHNIQGSMMVDSGYHQRDKLFIKPHESISPQIEIDEDESRLSDEGGALLMLPRGGVLKKFRKTNNFRTRISRYWREWYNFAYEEADMDETRSLCLLTGVEQCSSWAMAVWDSISSRSPHTLESLVLTVDKDIGNCSWAFPPPRCSTQSAPTLLTAIDNVNKETVLIRAWWIDSSNGNFHDKPSPPQPPPHQDGDEDVDGDSTRRAEDSRNQFDRHTQNSSNPSQNFNPFRNGSSSRHPYDSEAPLLDDRECFESSVNNINMSNIIKLPATLNTVSHPCQLINKLAMAIISKAQPFLLDLGFAALSHDEDWISLLEESDNETLEGSELLRRVCQKLKFVAEGDVVYTESMTSAESELIQQSIKSASNHTAHFPVLFHLREPYTTRNDDSTAELSQITCESHLGLPDNHHHHKKSSAFEGNKIPRNNAQGPSFNAYAPLPAVAQSPSSSSDPWRGTICPPPPNNQSPTLTDGSLWPEVNDDSQQSNPASRNVPRSDYERGFPLQSSDGGHGFNQPDAVREDASLSWIDPVAAAMSEPHHTASPLGRSQEFMNANSGTGTPYPSRDANFGYLHSLGQCGDDES